MLAQSPSDDSSDNIPGIKKDRMYCVCKSRYDPAKYKNVARMFHFSSPFSTGSMLVVTSVPTGSMAPVLVSRLKCLKRCLSKRRHWFCLEL